MITLNVINHGSAYDGQRIPLIEQAITQQANGDFRLWWLAGQRLQFVATPQAGAWEITVVPQSQMPLGYGGEHWNTNPPTATVGDAELGQILDEESLEMAADPYLTKVGPDGRLMEPVDPVEWNSYTSPVQPTVWLRDYVRTRWFTPGDSTSCMDELCTITQAGDASHGTMPYYPFSNKRKSTTTRRKYE